MHTPSLLVTLLLGFALSASALPLSPLSSLASTNAVGQSLVSDTSPVTLSVARRFNSMGSSNVLKFDQARAKALRQRAQADGSSTPATDASAYNVDVVSQVVCYVMQVEIGDPPQLYNLLVDTGSSNTWVGANSSNPYLPSKTSQPTGDVVGVLYGSGGFLGLEYLDQVTLTKGLTLPSQSIGNAILSFGLDGVDGILGIGPRDLTRGSFLSNSSKSVDTVTDSAYHLGLLDAYEIGISFHPSTTIDNKNGELTFGGVDETKFTDELHYVPITKTEPSRYYVGVDQEVYYGCPNNTVMPPTAGILDTGTTLILIATDAYDRYKNYTGGVEDKQVGLLRITPEQYANLQTLVFRIGDYNYELTPNAQIWPRVLNTAINGDPDAIYLIVNDLGSIGGQGLDFINGMSFLERFYMVYDVGGSRAGLATTGWTYAEFN